MPQIAALTIVPEARPLPCRLDDDVLRDAEVERGSPKAVLEAGKARCRRRRVVEVHGAESWSVMPNPLWEPLQSVPGLFKLALVTVA